MVPTSSWGAQITNLAHLALQIPVLKLSLALAHLRRSSAKAHSFTTAMLSCASLARPFRHRAQPKPLFWGGASTLFEDLQILQRGGLGGGGAGAEPPPHLQLLGLCGRVRACACEILSGGVGGGRSPPNLQIVQQQRKNTTNIGHPEQVLCLNTDTPAGGLGGGGGGTAPPICKYLACMPGFRDCACVRDLSGVPLEKPKKRGERQANTREACSFRTPNPVSSPGFACLSQHQRVPESTRLPMFLYLSTKRPPVVAGSTRPLPV